MLTLARQFSMTNADFSSILGEAFLYLSVPNNSSYTTQA